MKKNYFFLISSFIDFRKSFSLKIQELKEKDQILGGIYQGWADAMEGRVLTEENLMELMNE